MAGLIGAGVSLEGFYNLDSALPFNVTNTNTTPSNPGSIGLAVSFDPSAANSVQLAAADLPVLGVLGSLENRVQEGVQVGTVFLEGAFRVPYTGALVLGNSVVGSATAGSVKQGPTSGAFDNRTMVMELDTVNHTAVVLIL